MRKMILATHHKTGTILMGRVFIEIARRLDLVFMGVSSPQELGEKPQRTLARLDEVDILFDQHSTFQGIPPSVMQGRRAIHMIRDPRMVVVSSALYHQTSDEPWLHVPRSDFDGLTYQQKIQSLPTDRDRFLFEMDERSGRTIRRMQGIVVQKEPRRLDVKLEDLMVDEGLDHFIQLFRHLGFRGEALVTCLRAAFNLSVFNPKLRTTHIRSPRPESWRDYYDAELEAAFRQRFEGAVETLGYGWDA